MSDIVCPLECMQNLNPPDWLEKHNAFVLTLVGILGGGAGVLLSYFLKSRCTKIKCCGINCDREPITLDSSQVEVVTSSSNP